LGLFISSLDEPLHLTATTMVETCVHLPGRIRRSAVVLIGRLFRFTHLRVRLF